MTAEQSEIQMLPLYINTTEPKNINKRTVFLSFLAASTFLITFLGIYNFVKNSFILKTHTDDDYLEKYLHYKYNIYRPE